MARPSKFNDKIAKRILYLYSTGKNLLYITKLKGMPSRISIYNWRSAVPEFGKAYLVALEAHVESMIDSAFQRVMNATSKDAKLVDVQFKSASWMASKLNREKYGDKIDVQHSIIVDIAPALMEASKRMASVGVGSPQKVLTVNHENISESDKA